MIARLDPLGRQIVRQTIGTLVQFSLGCTLIATHQCITGGDFIGDHLEHVRHIEVLFHFYFLA
jgi:hypothetical protein